VILTIKGDRMDTLQRGTVRRTVAASLIAAVATLMICTSASAKVIGHQHFSDTYSFGYDDCGFPVDGTGQVSGLDQLRVLPGGQAFLDLNRQSFREVHTNVDTGKWFVVRGHSLYHEIRGTQVEGNIYEFTAIQAGQPFVIEDSSGRVVVRDRGVIRETYLFDTLGDGVPGGEFLGYTSIVVHGPHPGFADDFPFCEIAADLTQ
jgi:hypothetical protein